MTSRRRKQLLIVAYVLSWRVRVILCPTVLVSGIGDHGHLAQYFIIM